MSVESHEYELVVIVRPDIDDAVTTETIEKVEAILAEGGAHLLVRDEWGSRKLAYPISKHLKGQYFLIQFISEPGFISELERRLRINDKVIRFLTVKRTEGVDIEARVRQAAEQRRLREEERAKQAAAAESAAAEYDQAPSGA